MVEVGIGGEGEEEWGDWMHERGGGFWVGDGLFWRCEVQYRYSLYRWVVKI